MSLDCISDVEFVGAKDASNAKVDDTMAYFHRKPKMGESQVSILLTSHLFSHS